MRSPLRPLGTLTAAFLGTLVCLSVGVAPASADPGADTIPEARARLA
jgi:hypothetical protein